MVANYGGTYLSRTFSRWRGASSHAKLGNRGFGVILANLINALLDVVRPTARPILVERGTERGPRMTELDTRLAARSPLGEETREPRETLDESELSHEPLGVVCLELGSSCFAV